MLTLVHLYLGVLVVVTNALAAGWCFWLARQQRPLSRPARGAVYAAWGSLGLQVVLGLALIGQGGVGRQLHYVFALAAVVVSWQGATQSRRAATGALRILALSCAATALLTLGAYLVGQG